MLDNNGVTRYICNMPSLHKIYCKNPSVNSNSPADNSVNSIYLSRRERVSKR